MTKRVTALLLCLMLLFACAAAETLRVGSRGSGVSRLQTALKEQGYYTGRVDGVYGRATAAAVRAFQRSFGLKVDGIAGPKTQERLYALPAASSAGTVPEPSRTALPAASAAPMQTDAPAQSGGPAEKLWYLGYCGRDASGADLTEAVKAFQKKAGLKRDGIAGPKTLAALERACQEARANAPGVPDGAAALLNAMAVQSGAACGTLVLSRDGETFLNWSFGGADPDTCFRIASVTKWVTAIGLMTLYDRGLMDLDRDVSEYLPFRVRNPAWTGTPITARMLLSHTSSLSPDAEDYHPNWSRIGAGYDPVFDESVKPGTQYAYADFNGALFGALLEALTGEGVQDYMERTVFAPLGVTAAYTPNLLPAGTKTMDLLNASGKAAITVRKDRERSFNRKADPEGNNGYTVGRLYINASSLTRLAQMMLSGGEFYGTRVLNAETVALMEADQPGLAPSRYGLGTVRLGQFEGGTWYGHQGRYSGLSSNVYYQRETGLTVALVMNGYKQELEDNVVLPAVTVLRSAMSLWEMCASGAKTPGM